MKSVTKYKTLGIKIRLWREKENSIQIILKMLVRAICPQSYMRACCKVLHGTP